MFPSPYVPQSLCSPVHLFPSPYRSSPVSMLPSPYVPHSYSTEVFSVPFPIFATHDPQALCSPVPMFPSAYDPQCLCSPVPMFPMLPMFMTLFKIHFLQYGHSYYVYISNRYYLCSNELVCEFSLRLKRVTFEFGVVPIWGELLIHLL